MIRDKFLTRGNIMESVFLSINFKTIDPLIRENLFFFIEKSLVVFCGSLCVSFCYQIKILVWMEAPGEPGVPWANHVRQF